MKKPSVPRGNGETADGVLCVPDSEPIMLGPPKPRRLDDLVVFKLQLILVFEELRSGRQLMRVVTDRLSLRW